MPTEMTETAKRQGYWSWLVEFVGVLVALLSFTAVISLVTEHDIWKSIDAAVIIFWGGYLVSFLGTWGYGQSVRGQVLLDCGADVYKPLVLVSAVAMGLLAVTTDTSPRVISVTNPIVFGSLAAINLIRAFGWLRMCENGIWHYSRLLPWSKIASYAWTDEGELLVCRKGLLSRLEKLSIPPEHRQAVDDLLSQQIAHADCKKVGNNP